MFHGKRGVTPYVGPVGGLLPLHGSSSVEVSRSSRHTASTSLSGRVRVQRGPAARREWSVQVGSAYPEHLASLRQVADGLWGPGPFYWYDELAQVTNLLTPAASMCDLSAWTGVASGGSRSLAVEGEGRFLRSALPTQPWAYITEPVPVPPGVWVTCSVYMTAPPNDAASFSVRELDAEGAHDPASGVGVVSYQGKTVPAGSTLFRATTSFLTSQRTVALWFRTTGATMLAAPAITLTKAPTPWADGRGCNRAIFDLDSESVLKALPTPGAGGRRVSYSMKVREVG